MGRDAATSSGNVWREARLKAAKYNDELNSQDGVADLIGCGRDAIRRIENGLKEVSKIISQLEIIRDRRMAERVE